MKYGYFDDVRREYVITDPRTPEPWANYLGSPAYGAIISNNAGGYSFRRSGANGRILRYVFNDFDQPGRYVYIRDNGNCDYWSVSWQPVAKPLDSFKSVCRHGMGYSVISSEYSKIKTEVTYYVPLDREYEVWSVHVENSDNKKRDLTLSGFCEFTNENNYEQDQVNLQYTLFISQTRFENGKIRQLINGNLEDNGKHISDDNGSSPVERFFALRGADVSSYCGDKKEFLGRYRQYGNPEGIESGDLGNKLNYNGNSCGALSSRMVLEPGEKRDIVFILGMKDNDESDRICALYENDPAGTVKSELETLKNWWYSKFDNFKVHTPSREFDTMINTWNPYNCFMTFIWSRAASFIYCGLRNGYGYRDTVQDIQGVIHLAPDMAKDKIVFMLSAQVDNGGGLPLVKFTHNAGHEDTPDDSSYRQETGHPAYRADDALWLFPTVYKYIAETGDTAFLDQEIPFANRDKGTVYEHLRRAIEFSLNHLGPHSLPAGLYADWNDCLRLGADGESVFVAMQFYLALRIMKMFSDEKKFTEDSKRLSELEKVYREKIDSLCWNEDRFIRGFTEDGQVIGRRDNPEASMWLNPQSWSVISGLATEEESDLAMENVYKILNTRYGAVIMDPPFHAHGFTGSLAIIFNQGVKENGGIFSQTQGWLILAEALKGHGDRAFTYFMENAPSAQNEDADRRGIEPYAYGQFTEGKRSLNLGRSHVHWLTGTASTVMTGCVEGILGMRPDMHGLLISPSIPGDWDGLTIDKKFRGRHLHIVIENPEHKESGCRECYLNGKKLNTPYLKESELLDENEVRYIM